MHSNDFDRDFHVDLLEPNIIINLNISDIARDIYTDYSHNHPDSASFDPYLQDYDREIRKENGEHISNCVSNVPITEYSNWLGNITNCETGIPGSNVITILGTFEKLNRLIPTGILDKGDTVTKILYQRLYLSKIYKGITKSDTCKMGITLCTRTLEHIHVPTIIKTVGKDNYTISDVSFNHNLELWDLESILFLHRVVNQYIKSSFMSLRSTTKILS